MLSKAILYFWICALLISSASAGDVALAWDASVSPGIAGYKVYVGLAPRTYATPITIGNVTTVVVRSLPPGLKYFAVTAFDGNGNESDFSNEVSTIVADTKVCDINNDGQVNILDMRILASEVAAGTSNLSRDYNNDATVNALDLRVLANVILGVRSCP